jgi:hypothetical protein
MSHHKQKSPLSACGQAVRSVDAPLPAESAGFGFRKPPASKSSAGMPVQTARGYDWEAQPVWLT